MDKEEQKSIQENAPFISDKSKSKSIGKASLRSSRKSSGSKEAKEPPNKAEAAPIPDEPMPDNQ